MAPPRDSLDETDVGDEPDDISDADDNDDDDLASVASADDPAPRRRELDPAVAGILREEAEHEARLRAAETSGLESQGDLGLDSMPGAAPRSVDSQETSDRMARMRGETPDDGTRRTRSRLLPDVEEINSTLRAKGGDTPPPEAEEEPEIRAERRGGFARGFGLIVLLFAALVLIYLNAAWIAEAWPAAESALDTYVMLVDQGRVWLDSKLSGFIPE